MRTVTPRIEINLDKIRHNAKTLKDLYGKKGIQITGVVKGVGASLKIAEALVESGIKSLADSKIANIKKLKQSNLNAILMLLRTPALSEIEEVVRFADISMNTELDVVRALSAEAVKQRKTHQIILMAEMGDLREGILLKDMPAFIEETAKLPNIRIAGIGTNFACFGGVIPTEQKMRTFSSFVKSIQSQFSLLLPYVSGGNSANYNWMMHTQDTGLVNNIRLGESIFLGRETVGGTLIPNLYPDAFCFVAEVVESKVKPSVPAGSRGRNAFGETLSFKDRGEIRRAILGVGRQDVLVSGLTPPKPFEILGSSSDHIILDTKKVPLRPGDEVKFSVDYGAMLSAMTSPYVYKKYVYTSAKAQKASLSITTA
ncbi:alanine/ornithine racemase family PLP-dependent enzyme [Bacillus thermotolerans]|uniref:alanine/ornithine racemase family PLP-dependent enzyme n=1 Tax=Bacillus thermotolerans TaxID=1221996 RepID=UPI00057F8489|nr:alanine/ornithine racemase family PLP-dependent enzyme [Bacillus thermotolerans]KKB37412.1 putative amino acid racemase [Bacillus thermotolerans]